MTVAIGLVCSDGAVVASDSMSSSGSVARTERKVRALQNVPVVWTAAGSVYVIEEVEAALDDLDQQALRNHEIRADFTVPRPRAARKRLADVVRGAMTQCYQACTPGQQMQPTPRGPRHPFASDFLVLGFANGIPYFLEIAHDGQLNWHHDAGFYAVGSGGEFATVAHALLAHYVEGGRLNVELGMCVAYRTIDTTIRVSSAFVGPPVQLAVVDAGGARVLTDPEVEGVKEVVEGWMNLEAETLRQGGQAPGPTEELPVFNGGTDSP
mgnify:CR=1 FL=1